MRPILLSVPVSSLEVATIVDVDIELKFDWEDFDILSGERHLLDVLQSVGVDQSRVASIHLPPGVKTRGRDIGMAATEANVGAILDFVHAQLAEFSDAFLVMHPPRAFDYGDQLSLFSRLCDLSGHRITIENPPGESYWSTPEDIAFFGFVGETYPDWSNLYVTVDSKHLPAGQPPANPLDPDAVEDLFDRMEDIEGLDVASLRKAFGGHLVNIINRRRPKDADCLPTDGWAPLLNTLVLTGARVSSIHFNDPVDDGIPDLDGHETSPTLAAVRELLYEADASTVLEPNRGTYNHPDELRRSVESVREWLDAES